MGVVLVFFCIGALMASLHMGQWDRLPSVAPVVLGESLGWGWSVLLQLGVLVALGVWLSRKVPSAPAATVALRHYHGDTGQGLGAAHQTGWTGLLANLVLRRYRREVPAYWSQRMAT